MPDLTLDEIERLRALSPAAARSYFDWRADRQWREAIDEAAPALLDMAEKCLRLRSGEPDPDEVRMEGSLSRVNGWEAGQLAQRMGSDFNGRLAPGWRIKSATLRLSVLLEKTEAPDA